MATRAASHTTTDHEEIRRWAEERGADPACVRGTGEGDDPGMIRLDFPGFSGADSLAPISWDEWFRAFDENGLALLYQEQTARGERSNFNKLVSRETAAAQQGHRGTRRASGSRSSGSRKRAAGAGSRRRSSRARTRTAGATTRRSSAAKRGSRSRSRSASAATRGSSSRSRTRGRTSRSSSSNSRTRSSTSNSSQPKSSAGSRSSRTSSRSTRSSTRSRSQATRRRSASSGGSSGRATTARPLIDHEEIRRWAEERNAEPACVRRTGGAGDIGILRLDFPGYSGGDSLEHIAWDDWFDKFDERNLALLVQERTARGQRSNFNKLISRESGERSQQRKAA